VGSDSQGRDRPVAGRAVAWSGSNFDRAVSLPVRETQRLLCVSKSAGARVLCAYGSSCSSVVAMALLTSCCAPSACST
jgi:hypothetical protein